MDIQSILLNSIHRAIVDNWKIWVIIILFLIGGLIASALFSRAMRKAEKSLNIINFLKQIQEDLRYKEVLIKIYVRNVVQN